MHARADDLAASATRRAAPVPAPHTARRVARLIVAAAMGVVVGGAAQASQIFHSPADDGLPPVGPPTIAEGGVQSVFLYVDGGATASQPGRACHDGGGNEVCGYQLTLTGVGGLTLVGFTGEPGADLVVDQTSGQIVINGLDPVAPTPGPKRIGELFVDATTGGGVDLTSGEVIGADLGSEVLTPGTLVSVPEPGATIGLLSGILLLRRLGSRRARRC